MRRKIKICFFTLFVFFTNFFFSQDVSIPDEETTLIRYYNPDLRVEAFAAAFFFRDLNIYTEGLEGIAEEDISGDRRELRRWISKRLPKGKRVVPILRLSEKQKWVIKESLSGFYLKKDEIYFISFCFGLNIKECFFSFITTTENGEYTHLTFRLNGYSLVKNFDRFFGMDAASGGLIPANPR